MSDIKSQLKEHLKSAKDWEKMETPIPGVFVVKIPPTKTRGAMLNLEVNPLKEGGAPTKRKGLFISSSEMLEGFREALSDEKISKLMNELDLVNPEGGMVSAKKLEM